MANDDTLMQFPCNFPIKVMGKHNEEFEIAALSIIRKHFPNVSQTALKTRESSDGNYLALTVTVVAENQEQLDNVYQELTDCEHVVMAL